MRHDLGNLDFLHNHNYQMIIPVKKGSFLGVNPKNNLDLDYGVELLLHNLG